MEIRLIAITRERVQRVSLDQKRARWFGVAYLITFVTSIPALALFVFGWLTSRGNTPQYAAGDQEWTKLGV